MKKSASSVHGQYAEDRAARYLLDLGREIVTRNYRMRGGEIDIITREQDGTLVFTEVRQRTRAIYGTALESIHPRKYALMWRAAQAYLIREYGHEEYPCRLEVITIDGHPLSGELQLIALE